MSLENAHNWLKNHPNELPALKANLGKISRLQEETPDADSIVLVTIHAPALALSLLSKVNRNRGTSSGRDKVESPLAAVNLLGDYASQDLIDGQRVAEEELLKPDQLYLYHQLVERALHNKTQTEHWAQNLGYHQLEMFRVGALLSYIGEMACCAYEFDTYRDYLANVNDQADETGCFGFSFAELTEALCQNLNLPEIIVESLPGKNLKNPINRLIFHCAQICRLSESGWYTPNLQQILEEFADSLQMPVERVTRFVHECAITAAHESYVEQAWQPASRLILTSDQHWATHLKQAQPEANESPKQSSETPESSANESTFPEALQTIKHLVGQKGTTQSDIVNACLKGLAHNIGLRRVSLLMLSANQQQLQNRMSLGIEKDSSFRNFKIDVERSGLLKILLRKPQAIWINRENQKKYQKLLPPSLLASIMSDSFLTMSLFIGNKPIGLVYADHSQGKHQLTTELFSQFKQLISLTSKALTLLAKK